MENLLCFLCLENLPVPHIERLLTWSSSAPGPAKPDLLAADQTSLAQDRTAILARVSAPGRNF
jgi:hypothetical protein